MEKYLAKYGASEPRQFRKPSGIIMVKIDKYTGKVFQPDCRYPFLEAFKREYEEAELCNEGFHAQIHDYYQDDTDDR